MRHIPPIFVTKDRERPFKRSTDPKNDPIPNDIIPRGCMSVLEVVGLDSSKRCY